MEKRNFIAEIDLYEEKSMNDRIKTSRIVVLFLFFIYWSVFLLKTDAYYTSYALVEIFFCLSCFYNYIKNREKGNWFDTVFAMLFSLLITLANYSLFIDSVCLNISEGIFRKIEILIKMILFFIAGYFIFREILVALKNYMKFSEKAVNKANSIKHTVQGWKVFCGVFVSIVVLNTVIMFFSQYPGELSVDSIDQIEQFLFGTYTNHHSYYHTQLLHLLISIGYKLSGTINGAVAIYSEISIIIMGCCFSYIIYTLYELKCNIKIIAICFLWYELMPFHIMYSFTMWKDVFFGGAICVFITSTYRILCGVGKNRKIDYIVMITSAFGINLLRNNGTIVFLLSSVIFGILFWKNYRKILLMFILIIISSIVLNNPVQHLLGVKPADAMVSLSIPVQQIGRVVSDEKKLTKQQEETISNIISLKDLKKNYVNYIADPVMEQIRKNETQNYIKTNKVKFMKVYFQIGLKYPLEYVKAWIDQTKGYWNAGYDYWVWQDSVQENSFGIKRKIKSDAVNNVFLSYLKLYKECSILHIFLCIGFHVWLVLLAAYCNLIKKDKKSLFMTIPLLMIIFSLVVATPVYSEFRYAYALFCSMPFVLVLSFNPILIKKNNPLL